MFRWCITWWRRVRVFLNDVYQCYDGLFNYSCIPTKCYNVYSHSFDVVVCCGVCTRGYRLSRQGALTAGRLEDGDESSPM